MIIKSQKIEDIRRIELSVDGAEPYLIGNTGVYLVPEEICITYKLDETLSTWYIYRVSLDGYKKGKPKTPEWWIWASAINDWADIPYLAKYIRDMWPSR